MSDIKIVLFLTLIIFITGCVGANREVKVSATDGLQINEFSVDINDIFDGEFINFLLEVENVGGTTASHVEAQFFGPISGWNEPGKTGIEKKKLGLGEAAALTPPIADSSVPGEFDLKTWNIQSADLPQGISQVYDMGIRVRYDYSTSSVTTIDTISSDRYDELRKRGEFAQGNSFTQNTDAPIKVGIEALSPVRPDDGNKIDETVTLTVSNVGSGVAFTSSDTFAYPDSGSLGKISLEIRSQNPKYELECQLEKDGETVASTDGGIVTLKRGFETIKVPCSFRTVDGQTISTGVPKETVLIIMEARYSYAIDKTITIKVTDDGQDRSNLANPLGPSSTQPSSNAATGGELPFCGTDGGEFYIHDNDPKTRCIIGECASTSYEVAATTCICNPGEDFNTACLDPTR